MCSLILVYMSGEYLDEPPRMRVFLRSTYAFDNRFGVDISPRVHTPMIFKKYRSTQLHSSIRLRKRMFAPHANCTVYMR